MNKEQRTARIREGTALYNAGRARESARLLRTIEFAPDERSSTEYAAWCCNLGSALAETGELARAMSLFDEAAAIHESREEWEDLARVRFNLGNVSRYSGAFARAQTEYEAAASAYGRSGSLDGRVVALQSLGNLALAQNDHEQARARLSELAEAVPDESVLDGLTRWSLDTLRGNLERAEGRVDAAAESFARALSHLEGSADLSYVAEAEAVLGRALAESGRIADAIPHLDAAVDAYQQIGDPRAGNVAALRDAVRARLGEDPVDARNDAPAVPPASADAVSPFDAAPPGPPPMMMAAQNVSDAAWPKLLATARAQASGGIVLRVDGEVTVAIAGELQDWLEVDGRTASLSELDGVAARSAAGPHVLLQAARSAARAGVEARGRGEFERALVATGFALRAALVARDTRGIDAVSGNLLMLEAAIAAEAKRPIDRARPRDDEFGPRATALFTGLRELGDELAPRLERLGEEAAAQGLAPARLALLIALRRCLAAGRQAQSLDQTLLPQWAGGGVIGQRSGDPARRRRAVLAELAQLATDLDRRDDAVAAVYEELTHVRISELLQALNQPTAVSEALATQLSLDTAPAADTGDFDALWRLYQRVRPWIVDATDRDVRRACALAVNHFEMLRLLAVSSGTGSGHAASYGVSQFSSILNRDLVALLHDSGDAAAALEQAERTAGRAMADWMARTHASPRLVFRSGFNGSVGEVRVAAIDEIKAAAAQAECLVAYYLSTPAGWLAWLIGEDGIVASERLPDIEPLVSALADHLPYRSDPTLLLRSAADTRGAPLGRRPRPDVDAALARLGDALLPASFQTALAQSGRARLAVVTDGALHYVPFACLRPGGARYLVEDVEIVYWPSTTCTLLCEAGLVAKGARERLPSIVMGDPDLANPYLRSARPGAETAVFAPLPGTREEAAIAAERLGVAPDYGAAAALSTVLERLRGGGRSHPYAPVLHIAAHALLNTDNPEDSFVALADGPLRASFLYGFDPGIRVGLVVLSCCQTGLGGLHPDSVVGLANAFLVAGACSVLSTLWQVPDASTNHLMQAFYAASRELTPAATALRDAQRAILARPDWVHPLYWGAFKVSGANVRLDELGV